MDLINLIDLSKWRKMKNIKFELHREYGININSREWRNQVEKHNKKFASGGTEYYITHSNVKGFKATKEYDEALIAINDYKKRAFNMLKKASECDKAFGNVKNYKINFEKGEIE